MSTVMLETCREMKWINKYTKKCVKLVISKNLCLLCWHIYLFQPSFYKNPSILWGKVRQYSRTTIGTRGGGRLTSFSRLMSDYTRRWHGHLFLSLSQDSSMSFPKPVLHRLRSKCFFFQFPVSSLSLRSYSSRLPLLPRLPFASILPNIFPSVTWCRMKFTSKMWPIQLAFIL